MAGQKGRDILIKLSSATIGGMRAKSISLNEGMVDITDSDSAGRYRELLAAAGVKTVSMTGSGVFKDSAAENSLLTSHMAGAIPTMDFVVPGLGTFVGPFQCTQLQVSGGHDGEVQFSATFESGGEVTFS
jgi:TP901-1 family phage major tail protein